MEKKKAYFEQRDDGSLKLVLPEPKARKQKFNSMPFVLRAVRRALEAGREYHLHEIILLVTEYPAGQMLHPPFRGKHAQALIDRLVRKGKMNQIDGDCYVLVDVNEPNPRRK